MKLEQLIEQNESCKSADGLVENFGDYFLIKNNSLFSKIRKAAKKASQKFTCEPNNFYQVLPMSQLEANLNRQEIPFADNLTILKKISKEVKSPIQWDEISDQFKKNYIFHESCHAVIRHERNQVLKDFQALPLNEKIIWMLLEESFANTCELLAVVDAENQAHRIFFEANSYTALFEERTNIKNLISTLGHEIVFKFFLLSYLHSNFLILNLDDKNLNTILQFISTEKPTAQQLKALKALGKIPFKLDSRFREVTTGFYLRLNGIEGAFPQVLKFNFMKLLQNNKNFKSVINSILKIVSTQESAK